jgi:hypothetical protein
VTSAAPSLSVRRNIVLATTFLVVVPGFVALALLGSLLQYVPGLPGFWDYPSGTIGDAILLPAILSGLVLQAHALGASRPVKERRNQIVGGVLGGVGGAIVPLSWLLDPNTSHIWMLPRAHHFELAGWWHFAYLTASSAALGCLILTVLGRLRRGAATASPGTTPPGLQPTTMTVIVGAGLGMLVLIGRDAVIGGNTAASATTIAALIVLAGVFLGGLRWAVGAAPAGRLLTPLCIIAVFLVGLTAVVVRWQPQSPAVVGIGAVSALLGCAAATSRLASHPDRASYRWPLAVAMTTLSVGGLIRAEDALTRGASRPLLWLVGAVALTFSALIWVGRGQDDTRRAIRYSLFVGYCLFLHYLAARILSPHGSASAGASVSVADTAFDVMVFTLIQLRFADLGEGDKERISAEYVTAPGQPTQAPPPSPPASPGGVMIDMLYLGIAVGVSLFTLLAVAAGPLRLDEHAAAVSPDHAFLLIGAVLAGCLAIVGDRALARWRARAGEPTVGPHLQQLSLPGWSIALAAAPALAWAAGIGALSGGPVHLAGLAILVGLVAFTFTTRTLLSTTIRLHMLRPTAPQVILCVVVGAAIGFGSFWFVSMGIWHGRQPLNGGWLAGTTTCVFAGTCLVYIGAGQILACGLPKRTRDTQYILARETVRGYITLDAVNLGVVLLIGVGMPLYAATRDQELHASSLNVVASMVFLPGLISAVFWGLHNWQIWADLNRQASKTGVARPLLEMAAHDWDKARALEAKRAARSAWHMHLNRYSMLALLACGLLYLTDVLLQ